MPVALGFLANQVGLGNIGDKLKEIIGKVKAFIEKGLNWLVDKAVKGMKSIMGVFTGGKKNEKGKELPYDDPEKSGKVATGLADISKEEKTYIENGKLSKKDAEKVAKTIKKKHTIFKKFTVIDGGNSWDYYYEASEGDKYDKDDADRPEKEEDDLILPPGTPTLTKGTLLRYQYSEGKDWSLGDFIRYYKFKGNTIMIELKMEGKGNSKISLPIETYGTRWKDYMPGKFTVNYGSIDRLERPQGVEATLGLPLPKGSRATYKPPGYDSSKGHAKGHLLGKQFGGSGKRPENIVTLIHDPVNTPKMRDEENKIKSAVDNGEIIHYRITPIYSGNQLIPIAVSLVATGDNSFSISITIENKK